MRANPSNASAKNQFGLGYLIRQGFPSVLRKRWIVHVHERMHLPIERLMPLFYPTRGRAGGERVRGLGFDRSKGACLCQPFSRHVRMPGCRIYCLYLPCAS